MASDPQLVLRAYLSTYIDKVDWTKVFSTQVAHWAFSTSQAMYTKPEIFFALLFLVISALMGPKTSVKSDRGNLLKPNCYLFACAYPSNGKTPAFKNLVCDPLTKLEGRLGTEANKFWFQNYTSAGLFSALANNDGYGFVCEDEFGPEQLFGESTAESAALRHLYNNAFRNAGFSKTFKGGAKKHVQFTESYLTMGGTVHPDTFVRILKRIMTKDAAIDGFEDRLLILLCNPRKEFSKEMNLGYSADADPYTLSPNWPVLLYEVTRCHHSTPTTYTLAASGQKWLQDLRLESDQSYDQMIDEFEARQANDSTTANDAPLMPNDSKDHDYAVKFATLIHVLNHYLECFQRGCMENVPKPPTEISEEFIKKGVYLVSQMRIHYDGLRQAAKKIVAAEASRFKTGTGMFGGETELLEGMTNDKQILIAPGMATTSKIVQRLQRSNGSVPKVTIIVQKMDGLSGTIGEPGFVGQYVKKGKIHIFYKASWEQADQQFLKNKGITEVEYKQSYSTDCCVQPCSGVWTPQEWRKYWKGVLEAGPEWFKENSTEPLARLTQAIADDEQQGPSHAP